MQCMINICVAQYLIYSCRPCRDHVQRVRRFSINYRSKSSRKTIFLVLRLLHFSRAVAEKPHLIGHGSETCRKITSGYERDQLVRPVERSAALQLLESFPHQPLKLLRLRDEGLHPVLSKLRLKRHNILGSPYMLILPANVKTDSAFSFAICMARPCTSLKPAAMGLGIAPIQASMALVTVRPVRAWPAGFRTGCRSSLPPGRHGIKAQPASSCAAAFLYKAQALASLFAVPNIPWSASLGISPRHVGW